MEEMEAMEWGRSFSPEEEKALFPAKPKIDGRKKYRDLLAKVKAGDRKMLPLKPDQKVQGVKLQLGTVAKVLKLSLEYGTVVTEAGTQYLPVKVHELTPKPPREPADPTKPRRGRRPKPKEGEAAAS